MQNLTVQMIDKSGSERRAKAVLNNILLEDPKYGKAHNHIAAYKNKENDAVEAEKHYKLAIDFTPEYGPSYLNYAYLLSEAKRYDDLRDILTKAESVDDVNKSNLARSGRIIMKIPSNMKKQLINTRNMHCRFMKTHTLRKQKKV